MSKEKNNKYLKNLFFSDDLDIDFSGLNFKSLGISLSDINIEDGDIKNGESIKNQNDNNAPEEPLSDLSDNNDDNYINKPNKKKGDAVQNNDNIKRPNPILMNKSPINISKKEKITKITENNLSINVNSIENDNNNNFATPINRQINKNIQPNNILTTNKFSSEIKNHLNNNNKLKNENKPTKIDPIDNTKEKDMNLDLICTHNGEKIYRLSELFVPLNENVVRRVEKYISRTMNNTEKENKNDNSETPMRKDISEALEFKQMIKKSKRNQKFQKMNFTYNEKYFDKTFFLENININNTLADSLFNNKSNLQIEESFNNSYLNMKKENFIYNPENCGINETLKNELVESNLLNSLFYIRMKLKENNENNNQSYEKKNNIFEPENEDESERKINKRNINALFDDIENAEDKNIENEEIINFHDNFIWKNMNSNENAKFNNSNLEYIESINNNVIDCKESSILQKNLEGKIILIKLDADKSEGRNYASESKKAYTNDKEISIISGIDTIKDKESLFNNTYRKSELDARGLNKTHNIEDELLFNIIKSEDYTEKDVLFDKCKKKRHRQHGYINFPFKNGEFKNSILIDLKNSTSFQNFKNISKRIYDMNDYNMNLELLKQVNKKDGNQPEDLFSSISGKNNQSLATNTNSTLKIGKSKTNILTHAKCAYNLTYYKLNLTNEDLREFHRPNICKYFLKEKKKKNFSFKISENFDISNCENSKRWNTTILTRNYLKKKEKKRISKNIQYMNAYEIFKDRFKLSLVEGKFILFENIDEYPIYLSNFGMASKLKKYIYSNKLFNSSSLNPNVKLSESEIKTKNVIGPFGAQILLQPNKNPLLGHIDQNELKGITVVDNNMFRAPAFYEKLNNSSVSTSKILF